MHGRKTCLSGEGGGKRRIGEEEIDKVTRRGSLQRMGKRVGRKEGRDRDR